jgi:serine/threonine protein kinase
LTPPTSPPFSPANSPPLLAPNLSSPITVEGKFLTLFLTSEIGLRTSGVLHGGIAEADVGQQTASLKVTAKLAFVENHQDKLFHELSVYNHLASNDVKGIPPVLGMFHNARDQGPYCLVLRHAGLSIHDRNDASISISQLYVPYLLLRPVYLDSKSCSHQFDEVLKAIHDAGIVHGNLQLNNLLINDSGDVGIVDFDHARLSYDTKEHERERQSLAGLLKAVVSRAADRLNN